MQQRLLGGLQPLRRGLLRGDGAGNRVAGILVGHAGPRKPAVRAVLVPKAAFEPDGSFTGAELFDVRSRQSAIVRMLQPFRSAVEQFGLAPAKRFGPCRVDRS